MHTQTQMDAVTQTQPQMSTLTQTQEHRDTQEGCDPRALALQELQTLGTPGAGAPQPPPHRWSLHISPTVWAKEAFGNQLGKLLTIHNIVLQENTKHCPRNRRLQ